MRGKDNEEEMCGAEFRITPAYAGKSVIVHSCVHHKRDHPRLCGEKLGKQLGIFGVKGSPPPMRGKVLR